MIANRLEGGIHSGKKIKALGQILAAMGVTILNGANVTAWQSKGGRIDIQTTGSLNAVITTDRFLIATNASDPQLTKR